jgi:hypothetical protein
MKRLTRIVTAFTTLVEFLRLLAPKHFDFYLHLPRPTRVGGAILGTSSRTFTTDTWTNGKSHDAPPPLQFV